MDMSVTGALSAYAYQSTLTQTGSTSQALTQALASSQSQVADARTLLASAGPVDPLAALAGSANGQALTALVDAASASSGDSPGSVQAMLASLGGGTSALIPTSDGLPVSAVMLSPSTTEALVRYAYDQSQNPDSLANKTDLLGQQALLASGLNLLA
jgi:hypothetical protein